MILANSMQPCRVELVWCPRANDLAWPSLLFLLSPLSSPLPSLLSPLSSLLLSSPSFSLLLFLLCSFTSSSSILISSVSLVSLLGLSFPCSIVSPPSAFSSLHAPHLFPFFSLSLFPLLPLFSLYSFFPDVRAGHSG